MMICPESYLDQLGDATYQELIKERENLIRFIRRFEKLEKVNDRSGEEWMLHPTPEVQYQMYLEYLSVICKFMHEKYNEEYVHGDKRLSDSE